MVLDKIILKDFLTYSYLEYSFEKRPLLIQGLNLTDDKQKSNGSGKSGLQSAIEFCITASNSRDVRDSELVTYGKKQAELELFASCDVRKETIHIDWTIKVKGSNLLNLQIRKYGDSSEWEDESLNVSFSNVNDGKKFIMAWFAISKEDLFNYYIINNTRFKSFFKSSNTEKVDLINRFSDASIIDGLENISNEKTQEEYRAAEKGIDVTQGKIEHITEQLEKERVRDFAEELKEKREDFLEEIEYIEDKIEESKTQELDYYEKINEVQRDIKEVEEDIELSKKDKITIQRDIDVIGISIEESTKTLNNSSILVEKFPDTDWKEKRRVSLENIKDQNISLSEVKQEEKKLSGQENQILDFVNKLGIKLGGAITCPSCSHEFILDGDIEKMKTQKESALELGLKIEEKKKENILSNDAIKEAIEKIEEVLSRINTKEAAENSEKNVLIRSVIEATKNLESIKSKLRTGTQSLKECDSDISSYKRDITAFNESILRAKESIIDNKAKIKSYLKEIENFKALIEDLKAGNNKEYISTLKKDLKAVEKLIAAQRVEYITIGDKLYEMNQWANNFKQFRMYLANQSLSVIEYHCNRYLAGMGSDLLVKMEGFKVLANGALKEEITARIIRDQERTFNSFSGGERGRLLFASILANRHMINETHPYGGLDFLSIDEVFEGVDSIGLKHLIKSAKTLSITVMIITHVTDEEADSDTVTVVKENGQSRIKTE